MRSNNDFVSFEKNNSVRKRIISDNSYIEWLYSFLLRNGSFTNAESVNSAGEISEVDRNNIKCLDVLFECVDEYVKDNLIDMCYSNDCSFYRISYKDICFALGFYLTENRYYFCKKVDFDRQYNYIRFDDVLDRQCEITDDVRKLAEVFSMVIENAHRNGIPCWFIREVVNDTLDHIDDNKNGYMYKK